mgnify:CR=1 FL=1
MSSEFRVDQIKNTLSPQSNMTLNADGSTTLGGRLVFSDGSVQSKAPKIVYLPDTRSGCPGTLAAYAPAVSYTFTLNRPAFVYVAVNTIGNSTGRFDTLLYADNVSVRTTLTDTTNSSWKPAILNWGGTFSAGTHTIHYTSSSATVLGCGADYGGMTIQIFES